MSGMETPDTIDLRKRIGIETPDAETAKELYHIVQEKQAQAPGQFFGSDRKYVLPGAESELPKGKEEEVGEKRKKTNAEAEANSSGYSCSWTYSSDFTCPLESGADIVSSIQIFS